MYLQALPLNIGGSEWIIIILLGIVLLFGAKRLPQISRSFGKAMGEYEKARELFRKEMEQTTKAVDPKSYFPTSIQGPVASEREKLEVMANSLGIDSAGKTDEQLRALISQKIQD